MKLTASKPMRLLALTGALVLASSTALAVTYASDREKKSERLTFLALSAARYLACPNEYGEKAVASYIEETDWRKFRDYTTAAEFDPAKRDALIPEMRAAIETEANRQYHRDRRYTIADVEVTTDKYDAERGGFWFKMPPTVRIWWPNPKRLNLQWWWYRLHQGTQLTPNSIPVILVYPAGPPMGWGEDGRMFVPVEREVAQHFVRQYENATTINTASDGSRRALAYIDVEITGCNTKELGVDANIRGIRIYAPGRTKFEAIVMVYEWGAEATPGKP